MSRAARLLAAAAAIVATLAVQATILGRLPLPGNAPSLPLVLVVAVALAGGVWAGAAMGFCTGLAADLISDHPLGLLALVLLVVGWLVGGIEAESERSVFWSIVVVAVASAGSFLAYLAVYSLVNGSSIPWRADLRGLPEGVLYDVMLTPFVVPVVAAAERRLTGRR